MRTPPFSVPIHIRKIVRLLKEEGFQPYLVGGCVRDYLLGIEPKDIDIEVYGCSYEQLVTALSSFGKVDIVGKSFGVVKIHNQQFQCDLSLPRKDSKIGRTHKDFTSSFDPKMALEEGAKRRDFTINSIFYEVDSTTVLDFFGGVEDLRNGILRHTSEAFLEDPLRVLRGMQFSARFNLTPTEEYYAICRKIISEYSTLPKERVREEWAKLLTNSLYPGKAIEYLVKTGWIDNYPEIKNIYQVPQDPKWHPEGTVDIHTAFVMNEAARLGQDLEPPDRVKLILAALCHDLGKALPENGGTTIVDPNKGIISPGHAQAGLEPTKSLLTSMGFSENIVKPVQTLVKTHMDHIDAKVTNSFVLKLANKLKPTTFDMWARLVEADHMGRPPIKSKPPNLDNLVNLAKSLKVFLQPPTPLIMGKDLIPYYGERNPKIGEVLKKCYSYQINHGIVSKNEMLIYLDKAHLRSLCFINGDDVIKHILPGPTVRQILDQAWQLQVKKKICSRQEMLAWLEKTIAITL